MSCCDQAPHRISRAGKRATRLPGGDSLRCFSEVEASGTTAAQHTVRLASWEAHARGAADADLVSVLNDDPLQLEALAQLEQVVGFVLRPIVICGRRARLGTPPPPPPQKTHGNWAPLPACSYSSLVYFSTRARLLNRANE